MGSSGGGGGGGIVAMVSTGLEYRDGSKSVGSKSCCGVAVLESGEEKLRWIRES